VSDLFIAPDGARQFHINKRAGPSAGICIWVVPFDATEPWIDRRVNKCSCTTLWRILVESFPPKHREAVRILWRRNGVGEFVVCECVGEIIE
jgi:hypothetical protein